MNVSPSEASTFLHSTLQRLAGQSATCKLWSVVLSSVVLALAAGRMGAEAMVWAAAPALLLALADATYKVQADRAAALAAKGTVRMEDLFRLQSGGGGLAGSVQTLGGLASFSVWPFYVTLATMVMVLGQTVLTPQNKAPFGPPGALINGGPSMPGVPRPAYAIQQGPTALPPGAVVYPGVSNVAPPSSFTPSSGSQSFTPPPGAPKQVTVTRPNMPPMGVPASKASASGATAKAPPVGLPSPPSQPAQNKLTPQPPKIQPAQNSSASKPAPTPTQPTQ